MNKTVRAVLRGDKPQLTVIGQPPMERWLKHKLLLLAEKVILRSGRSNSARIYFKHHGIWQHNSLTASGEDLFISRVLKSSIPDRFPILFDVGANIGDYSATLLEHVPSARIFAFEPNPASFKTLSERFSKHASITALNVGLGRTSGDLNLYDYTSDEGSAHATLHLDVMKSVHHCTAPKCIRVTIETLEAICRANGIDRLNFLKIDTEGNEFSVLEGARNMIAQQKIDIIQFEFNEMNVISRVFLRDFYDLLPEYSMFRLSEHGLIGLGDYNARHEIFAFQNIVAARKDIAVNWRRFCL
jgi:FkbM family methyltransferase